MTDVRPPMPPDDGVTVLRPEFGGRPRRRARAEPVVDEYPPDPEATEDTQEISLAELRAAAIAAGVELDEVEVPRREVVDLAAAERDEAPVEAASAAAAEAELDVARESAAPASRTPTTEPRPGAEPEPGVAAYAGPFGEPGARSTPTRPATPPRPMPTGSTRGSTSGGSRSRAAEGRRRLRILLAAVAVASCVGIAWLDRAVAVPRRASTSRSRASTEATRLAVERAADVDDGTALAVRRHRRRRRAGRGAAVGRGGDGGRELPERHHDQGRRAAPGRVGPPPGAGRLAARARSAPVAVVDATGRVLGDEPQPPAGLPELVGLDRVPGRGDATSARGACGRARRSSPTRCGPRRRRCSTARRPGRPGARRAIPGGGPPAADEVRLGAPRAGRREGRGRARGARPAAARRRHGELLDVRVPGAPATR